MTHRPLPKQHNPRYSSVFEIEAYNVKTGRRIFTDCTPRKSLAGLRNCTCKPYGDSKTTDITRLSLALGLRDDRWMYAKKAADGFEQGDWRVRFSGRTGLDVDNTPPNETLRDLWVDYRLSLAA